MSEFVFYAQDRADELALADGLVVDLWRPSWRERTPPGADSPRWLVWWLFDRTLVFRRRWYAVLTVRDGGEIVHRSVLFPRFFRFPTVAQDELQIGDVWTHPDHRGRGLAKIAIQCLLHHALRDATRVWYITETSNVGSRATAEACGFVVAGTGRREPRFGLSFLGRYVLDA